jgi:hypothetical protein
MATQRKPLLKIVEEHFIKWVIGLFTSGIVAFVIFYFNTEATLAQHSQEIHRVSEKIDTIGELPAVNTVKIQNMERQLNSIKTDGKELKTDFKDFQKKYDADRDRILMILLEIKENARN